MNTVQKQTDFGDKFARPIKPNPAFSEPFLWFQDLHLVRRLGIGDTPENRIRSLKLRPGLNILWAEPEDPVLSGGLYGDGFAGHATGKTLFCRILRHLLGEPNYGTEEVQEHVRGTFKELWAIATVRLNGRSWAVGRPLAGLGDDFAIEGADVQTAFQAVPASEGYKKFTEALERECGDPLSKMYPSEGWRNLLPWIARDQEARFSTIVAWRDSSSEADNPRTSVAAQHLILRAVLGLLDWNEFEIRQEIASKEENLKDWTVALPTLQTLAKRDRSQVARTLQSIPRCNVEVIDLAATKEYITGQLDVRQEAIEHFSKQPESPEVQAARAALQDAASISATAAARIRTLAQEIPTIRQQAENSLLIVDKIKKKGLRDPKRVTDDFCPNSYLIAVERQCVPKSPEDIDSSMAEIADLEAQAKALADTVQARLDEKARLESQTDQLAGEIKLRQRALSETIARFPSPALAIERDITLLRKAEAELAEAVKSEAEEKALDTKISKTQSRIVEQKETLNHLKSVADRQLRSFSDIFADIIRAFIGASVSASADMGERGIHLRVRRTQELGGAAVESVKTIAFDLAALLHAIEGNCAHPRFLIHDGPREADMARVIYERFFLYARRLEDALPPEAATFQYILTTTTPPPVDMQEGSKWLLGEKLSGATKAGRLLKEDF